MRVLALLAAAAGSLPGDLAFQDWLRQRGVRVEIARVSQGPPWIRGTAEIAALPDRIAQVVTDYGRYREIFAPALKIARVLEGDRERSRLHLVWPFPFPLRNRDAVVEYAREELPEGGWRIFWRDAARPGDPREGVRIARVLGETRIEPLEENRSRVTYLFLGDLGGKFPRSAEEKAWREEPVQYIRALRRALGLPDPVS